MHSWLSIIFLKISEFRDVFWVCYFVLPVDYLGVCRAGSRGHPARAPIKLEKIWFFGVKSWFFTRNTPKMFAPPSVQRNFFKCTPPPLTWNPGSTPDIFMNMIIWPLMTYTVTSFGKAFAHVRNCLLKKSTCYKWKYWRIIRENDTKEDSASFV